MIETTTTSAIIIIGVIAGVGGLAGGMLSGRRTTAIGSILVGMIGGIVTAVILSAFDSIPNFLGIGEYSAVWALVGGAVMAFLIGYSSQ